MITNSNVTEDFANNLSKLIELAANDHYNPYKEFDWPETMPEDQYWMSPDLLSVYGTPLIDKFSDSEIISLSKWESINFYSMNVHGIRELLLEVISRIHTPGFELPSEFFHHFVGEENEHMWFFSKFCLKYGKKIYADKKIKIGGFEEPEIQHFLVFARILIFEELVDFYNLRMANDRTLNPVIRKINSVHHQDESRHIAFGREIVKLLHAELRKKSSQQELVNLSSYLKRYITASISSFYNPAVYKDAGIPEPYRFRNQLLEHADRKPYHTKMVKRTLDFFLRNEIILDGRELL